MLKTQEYLQTLSAQRSPSEALDELERTLGIAARRYPDRVVLNYDQISSPKHDPIVRECRALILSYPDFCVLSRAFDRFYNYGEDPEHEKFDLAQAIIDEKVDGSLISVYHDGKEWQCATRGTAFAEGSTWHPTLTFRDIFERAIGGKTNDIFDGLCTDYAYIFEVVSPETRVVTPYQETACYLIGLTNHVYEYEARSEQLDTIANSHSWRRPKRYNFRTLDACLAAIAELPAFDEGYVAKIETPNRGIWRIKLKNPAYLAIAHLRNNGVWSAKRIAELVWSGDEEEYLGHFPEHRPMFMPFVEGRTRMLAEIDRLWQLHRELPTQKEFAMAVKDSGVGWALFLLRKGVPLNQVLGQASANAKVEHLQRFAPQTLEGNTTSD